MFIDIANSITWGQQETENAETPVEELENPSKSAFLEDVNILNKEKIEVFAIESFPSKNTEGAKNEAEKKNESNF